MRVALYACVSTNRQALTQSIDQQLDRLREYVVSQGWPLSDADIFRDDGHSGATLNRPGLDRLRDKVRAAEVDRILLTAPDRLARNYVHQMVLLEELERTGCQVQFLDRPMTADPHDHLLLQIRGAVAEYERTLIAERMRRGRLAKYRAGVLLPWTRRPFGYSVDPDRPRDPAGVRVDEVEAAVIKQIFAQYLEPGGTLNRLVRHLMAQGVRTPSGHQRWSQATVRVMLTNLTYTGQLFAGRWRRRDPKRRLSPLKPIGLYGGEVLRRPEEWTFVTKIPAIISEEEFELVRAKLARNRATARRNNHAHDYLLRALVSCGLCKLTCPAKTMNKKNSYYICQSKMGAVSSRRDEYCPARFIPAKQLDEIVWQDLCVVMREPELIRQALERAWSGNWLPQEMQARRENLRRGRRSLERQIERLTEAYLEEVIPLAEYERRRRDLEQREEALGEQAQQMERQVERTVELAGVVTSIEDFAARIRQGLDNANFEQKRQLVELLIDRVVVSNEEVEIRYVVPTNKASEQVHFSHLRADYRARPSLHQEEGASVAVLQTLSHGGAHTRRH
jgi:site-specific DNA recombinase